MHDENASPDAVAKSSGLTEAERYLEALCERNFLGLWSYPRPFRDQGGNKELCDLLAVMGDDVIIFSDKHCDLIPNKTLEIDWQRWFRSAVQAGAKQAWGAERWLRKYPQRVFVDPACIRVLPVRIPPPEVARYHLVVTVHGVSAACHAMFGGTGSLMLRTDITGLAAHVEPFVIGDLDPERSFVHVFDDATLDIVMTTLDTTADFLRYLREKERLCRSRVLFVAGEENLLAHYLMHLGDDGGHALVFDDSVDTIALDESWWESFATSEERRAQLKHDEVSYVWDSLIARFTHHALAGTQYHATEPALQSSEVALRFMAAEPRLRRRSLGGAFIEALETTPSDHRRIRVIPSQGSGEPMYVFVLVPWFADQPEADNRDLRRRFLEACIFVARMKQPGALDVIGIATESGIDQERRSEDALYFNAREWGPDDDELARSYQQDLGILVNEQMISRHVEEYPLEGLETSKTVRSRKTARNSPCPCGSGQKYKRCHGRQGRAG